MISGWEVALDVAIAFRSGRKEGEEDRLGRTSHSSRMYAESRREMCLRFCHRGIQSAVAPCSFLSASGRSPAKYEESISSVRGVLVQTLLWIMGGRTEDAP